jgi:hypothetical protein
VHIRVEQGHNNFTNFNKHTSNINCLIQLITEILFPITQHQDSTDTSTGNVEESSTNSINRQISFVLWHIYPDKIAHVSPLDRRLGEGEKEGQITALAGNEITTVQHVTSLTVSMHVNIQWTLELRPA